MKIETVLHMDTHKVTVTNATGTEVFARIATPYGHVWYRPTANGFLVEEALENALEGMFNVRDTSQDRLV